MKYLTFSIFLFISLLSFSQEETSSLNWLTNLEDAKKISKKTDKPILLYFTGSDWCAPCKMLKEDFFESPEFIAKAEDMVLVLVDYPRRIDLISEEQMAYNKVLLTKYNTEKVFPNLMFLDAKGKKKDELSGYSSLRDTQNHFKFINKYIK